MYFDSGFDTFGVMAKALLESFGKMGDVAFEAKWLGVLGWLDDPRSERCHLGGGSSTGDELDSAGEERLREVDEEAEVIFEVSSAPEEVMSRMKCRLASFSQCHFTHQADAQGVRNEREFKISSHQDGSFLIRLGVTYE